ncbi:MAG: dihydrodipicolinate synthase family protein [Cyclobacteriaceae bacterium]
MIKKNFESIPVMITPFTADGAIDYHALNQLTEFYISTGSTGLFTNCLSGEMYELSDNERIELTRAVVDQVNQRQEVVATGTFGYDVDEHIEFIKKIYDTGVSAVIINSNQITLEAQTDDEWKTIVDKIIKGTDGIDLGVYECPVPYKRLLSPEITGWLAKSGRFKFVKETSCHLDEIKLKLSAVAGTEFGIYNANIATGLESIKAGAKGFASTSSNFYPEFINYFSESTDLESEGVKKLNAFITCFDVLIHTCYPTSAKYFMKKRGLEIDLFTRTKTDVFTYQDYVKFDKLYYAVEQLAEELGIDIHKW